MTTLRIQPEQNRVLFLGDHIGADAFENHMRNYVAVGSTLFTTLKNIREAAQEQVLIEDFSLSNYLAEFGFGHPVVNQWFQSKIYTPFVTHLVATTQAALSHFANRETLTDDDMAYLEAYFDELNYSQLSQLPTNGIEPIKQLKNHFRNSNVGVMADLQMAMETLEDMDDDEVENTIFGSEPVAQTIEHLKSLLECSEWTVDQQIKVVDLFLENVGGFQDLITHTESDSYSPFQIIKQAMDDTPFMQFVLGYNGETTFSLYGNDYPVVQRDIHCLHGYVVADFANSKATTETELKAETMATADFIAGVLGDTIFEAHFYPVDLEKHSVDSIFCRFREVSKQSHTVLMDTIRDVLEPFIPELDLKQLRLTYINNAAV